MPPSQPPTTTLEARGGGASLVVDRVLARAEAERDAPLLRVDGEDLVTSTVSPGLTASRAWRRCLPAPARQTPNSSSTLRRDLHERAEGLGAHDLTLDERARPQRRRGVVPRIALEGLERELEVTCSARFRIVPLLDARPAPSRVVLTASTSTALWPRWEPDLRRGQQTLEPPTSTNAPKSLSAVTVPEQHGARDELGARLDGRVGAFLRRAARGATRRRWASAAIVLEARHAEEQLLPDVDRRIGHGPQLELWRRGRTRARHPRPLDAALVDARDEPSTGRPFAAACTSPARGSAPAPRLRSSAGATRSPPCRRTP